ncbi:hypothetical protein CFIMG_007607RA00001 [Ceratocystis fimbriata CBS 114723]|uniref:Hydantoin utilization protein A n=1 Tax=Ceratocystis fimbriata CBS 114723 TaxID=1035309 RepID=A0A2C5W6E9_9PEZI|nr:hypothetical protein CFIMG_007607RA00001 [Ceratocystis fimbriata CBS 114723]
MPATRYVIGVDVGGTNTDAVVLNPLLKGAAAVKATYKAPTGCDLTTGIEAAIAAVLSKAAIVPSDITALMIGTTHFINAVVERDAARLDKVAAIRLCAPSFTSGLPPFVDFPEDLSRIMKGYTVQINGGLQIEGDPIAMIDEAEVNAHAATIKALGLRCVVVTGVNSPQDESYRQEETVASILRATLGPSVSIVCSKDVSGLGLLERENAAIINASILRFAQGTIRGFQRAMDGLELVCPLYLTSNSGHLLTTEEAMKCPVSVFSSGPTNSLRGAAFLAQTGEADISPSMGGNPLTRYVIDIGGTTTDIGCLLPSGFPRLASAFTTMGGVRVNFSMPQTESTGLGGGSVVRFASGTAKVGPDSVAKDLALKAKCFGGDVLTSTDIMVATGKVSIGSVRPTVEQGEVLQFTLLAKRMIEDNLDRMKTSSEPCSVILVGGASFLCPPSLDGVSNIEIPKHAEVANAIGAAVGEVGASIVTIVDESKKDECLVQVKKDAFAKAIEKGALKGGIRIIEEEVSGLPYVDRKFKISVKVAGPIDYEKLASIRVGAFSEQLATGDVVEPQTKAQAHKLAETTHVKPPQKDDYVTYRPTILPSRLWSLTETDLLFISRGCYILGCGGGGSPYANYLEAKQLIQSGASITVIDIEDLADDAKCPPVAGLGSPMVGLERPGSRAVLHAIQEIEHHQGFKTTATLGAEIGGGNGMEALLWASSKFLDVPCVDADLMGRAYPRFECSSLFIGAKDINELLPAALASGDGTNFVLTHSKSSLAVDQTLRAACMTMGSAAGIACRPVSKSELQNCAIRKSISLAWRLGRAASIAQAIGATDATPERIVSEFGGQTNAGKVFEGKIVGVGQYLSKGHTYGRLTIERLAEGEGNECQGKYGDLVRVEIPFINENLVLEGITRSGERKIIASVPDLIMILDSVTAEAVGVPEYRYGLRVIVMVANAHTLWTTQRGLEIGGPAAFGYSAEDLQYRAAFCGGYGGVKSVIDEYGPPKAST